MKNEGKSHKEKERVREMKKNGNRPLSGIRGHVRAAACMLAAVLGVSVLCGEAGAESPVTDPERTASLTICKLKDNDAQIVSGTGYLQSLNGDPMEGIVFTIVKIADIAMVTEGGEVSAGFAGMDPGFLTLLADNGIQLQAGGNGDTAWYDAEAVSGALLAMNRTGGASPGEVQINDFVRGHESAIALPATDSAGKASVTGLPQGLYLAAETDVSGYISGTADPENGEAQTSGEVVYNPSSPFLVSLPMTGRTSSESGGAGSFWQYDVTVYPKNQTVSIPKYIVREKDGDTLQQTEDLEIGEAVKQVIAPSAPAVEPTITDTAGGRSKDRRYESYRIRDTMQEGLCLLSSPEEIVVKLGVKLAAPERLSDFDGFETLRFGEDYTVVTGEDRRSFEIVFQQAGLDRLNAAEVNSQAAVIFDCVLDGEASPGAGTAEAVKNQPELIWKNVNTAEASVQGNQPCVYTYRLQIRKLGLKDGTKAAISVSRGGEEMIFAREAEGIYHVWDAVRDAGQPQNRLSPSGSGDLEIRGLDADVYRFTETRTEEGHELLKSSFEVTLSGQDPSDGTLADAHLVSDGKEAPVSIDPAAAGTAVFAVRNYPSILLRTGGSGLLVFEAAGLTVLALALALRRRLQQL